MERWQALEADHVARADRATRAHRERRQSGRPHPVEDFLFTYYPFRPAQLRRWHPGPGVPLEGAAPLARARWRYYRTVGDTVELDVTAYLAERADTVELVRRLVSATQGRAPQLGCFGLHEWAMVYRLDEDRTRHRGWPLRLGRAGTDAVVEGLPLRCTHYDAFRFYTPPARSLNLVQPSRDSQVSLEQPGCLHAGMDLYKWAFKLGPAIPGELLLDCFDLAREIRELDMRASPYDLSELGYSPVCIERPSGRAEYAAAQRGFAARGQALRLRLLRAIEALELHAGGTAAQRSPTRRPDPCAAPQAGP
ncbi:3-methyladenine DNA glycosylase [Pedococcus sp. 5OH_020]|uniref:3-methyladenine DNA glycosylase n=1 Tax=Pedococcus sp. 5OH_020 TaxID=2989814 RepID=UPI0022E9F03A|nr:3-methyladenine DNA glycosylase [Pedococcus sp. 5OH_020]